MISLDGIRSAYNGPTRIAYNGPTLESFCSFQKQFHRKTVDFSGIQTRTIRLEFEHADHLTTTGFKEAVFTSLFRQNILSFGFNLLAKKRTIMFTQNDPHFIAAKMPIVNVVD